MATDKEPLIELVGRTLADADEVRQRAKEAKDRLKAEVKEPAARAKANAKEVKQRLKEAAKEQARDESAAQRTEREQRQRSRQQEARRRAEEHRAAHAIRREVLQDLQHEHHLWWMRPDRTAGRRGARDRAEVLAELVEAAVHIADLEGFDAVSMRRLAQEVGLGTMSLYWYVEGKDDLLDLVLDHLIGEALLEPDELTDWRTGLTAIARHSRAMFLAHPWLVQVMGRRPYTGPNLLRHIDQSLAVVDGLDLPSAVKMQILRVVDDFTAGQALGEVSDVEVARTVGMTEAEWHEHMRPHYEAQVEEQDLGHLGRYLAEHSFDEEQVDGFEGGLAVVLDGIEALIARQGH
jgi:AcrR family transcriptional regulator